MTSLHDFLNPFSARVFVERFGNLYEGNPWVADSAFLHRPFRNLDELHRTMSEVVRNSQQSRKLAILRGHPELGVGSPGIAGSDDPTEARPRLSAESTAEQRGAGLLDLSGEEREVFLELNRRYRTRFGFPFVVAVEGLSKDDVLAALERRSANDLDAERVVALDEVNKIARLRLDKLVREAGVEDA